jgi:hypothetical protein
VPTTRAPAIRGETDIRDRVRRVMLSPCHASPRTP